MTIVSWCPGDACDPCKPTIGVRLDADGNIWLPISGSYYTPFQMPFGIVPFDVQYNGLTVWTFTASAPPVFITNADAGHAPVIVSGSLVTGSPGPDGTPGGSLDAPDGTYQEWVCNGNILVGNLLDGSVTVAEPLFRNGIFFTLGAPYTGPTIGGVTNLTVNGAQFFPLPYFGIGRGLTIGAPALYP